MRRIVRDAAPPLRIGREILIGAAEGAVFLAALAVLAGWLFVLAPCPVTP